MNNSFNIRFVAKLLVTLLVCQSELYAERKGGDGFEKKRGLNPRSIEGKKEFDRFLTADVNGDGMVDFPEFSNIEKLSKLDEEQKKKLYDFLDQDGDGQLFPRELKPAEPKWKTVLIKRFSKFDEDNSDDISFEEFSQLPAFTARNGEGAKYLFGKVDQDKNGAITLIELQSFTKESMRKKIDFSQYDQDESGGLNYAEYSQLPMINKIPKDRIKEIFTRIDKDDDGEISADELQEAHERRRASPHRGQKPSHR